MTKTRYALAALGASAAVIASIAGFEGFRDKAYPDPVHGWDVPTIGYGTTAGVKPGDTITKDEAIERLGADVNKFGEEIKKCIGPDVPLSQGEFDAFVSLSYNVGTAAFCRSSIPLKLRNGRHDAACTAILTFKYLRINGKPFDCSTPGNKICAGIWTRRQAEYQRCISG
jgi:lysozyme